MFNAKNSLYTFMILSLACHLTSSKAFGFPLSIQNCDSSTVFTKAPERAVAIDINQTELMLKLGLAESMIADAGVAKKHEILPELQAQHENLHQLSSKYPSLEALLAIEPDFVLAGWQYGFSETTGITPERLAKMGIGTYAIRESCIRIMQRDAVSLNDTFEDILNIGRIFAVEDRARSVVAIMRQQLSEVPALNEGERRPRVFLYDSGEKTPFTAGGFAIPTAMIHLAGGQNIFSDLPTSWANVSWEAVIEHQPELVIIVDYDEPSADEKWKFLQQKLGSHEIPALKHENYIVLPYASATPGIRNADAVLAISRGVQKVLRKREQTKNDKQAPYQKRIAKP
ncbi:MAG: ABC transporter substrate-binding protein [Oligoflexus sp.]